MSRGLGKKKAFFMRCIDEECGYVHSLKIMKNNTNGIHGKKCPSCKYHLSYIDFHSLDWLNTNYYDFSYFQELIDDDAIQAGIAWANS